MQVWYFPVSVCRKIKYYCRKKKLLCRSNQHVNIVSANVLCERANRTENDEQIEIYRKYVFLLFLLVQCIIMKLTYVKCRRTSFRLTFVRNKLQFCLFFFSFHNCVCFRLVAVIRLCRTSDQSSSCLIIINNKLLAFAFHYLLLTKYQVIWWLIHANKINFYVREIPINNVRIVGNNILSAHQTRNLFWWLMHTIHK